MPPLTKQQFAKRQDKGGLETYTQYLRWYATTVAPRVAANAPPYPGYMSPAAQRAAATQSTKDAMLPAQQDLERQLAKIDADARARAADAQGLAAASARAVAPIAGQIQQDYGQAADRQTVIAKGYSEGFQKAVGENAGDANALLAKNGAPAGQQLATSSQAGDVIYGTGGAMPGGSMNREGAAFTAAARQLPSTQLGLGQQRVGEVYRARDLADEDIAQRQRDLAAQFPGLYRESLHSLQTGQREAQLATRTFDLQTRAQKMNEEYLRNAMRTSGAEITGVDPETGAYTYEVVNDAANRDAAVASAGATAAGKRTANHARAVKARNTALTTARKTVYSIAQSALGKPIKNPTPDSLRSPGLYLDANGHGTNNPAQAQREGALSWNQAFNRARVAIADDLAQYGVKRAEINKLVRARLIAAGLTPPAPRQTRRRADLGKPTRG